MVFCLSKVKGVYIESHSSDFNFYLFIYCMNKDLSWIYYIKIQVQKFLRKYLLPSLEKFFLPYLIAKKAEMNSNLSSTASLVASVTPHNEKSPTEEERKSTRYQDILRLSSYALGIFIFFVVTITFYIQWEHWTFLDTVYFIIVTLATVGYGHPAPSDDSSRLFTIFVIIIGIFFVFAGIKDFIHNNLSFLRDFFCKRTSQQVAEDFQVYDVYHNRRRMYFYVALMVVLLIIGAITLKNTEDWTWIEAFYFAVETSAVSVFLFDFCYELSFFFP
jgi:hypothetical protein